MNRAPDFDLVLDQALDALALGQPPAAIAARYAPPAYPAGYAERLLPLLQAAAVAAPVLAASVPAPDLARGRRRFLAAASQPARAVAPAPRLRPVFALALVVVLVGMFALAPHASAGALPGDLLYPVKRAVESVQLAFTSGPARREALNAQLADRRRQEAARLLAIGREARLAFEGVVEAVEAQRLVVSGLSVSSPQAAAFRLGDRVAVQGATTRAGTLVATRIALLAPSPVVESTPSASPTPAASSTRPARPATATPPPTRRVRPTASLTAAPRLTRTLSAATAVPPSLTPRRPTPTASLSAATASTATAVPPTARPAVATNRPPAATEITPTQRPRP